MRSFAVLALALSAACSAGLKGDYFQKDDIRYRVGELDPNTWKRVRFAENDLAWLGPDASVLAMNATCKDFGDAPLDVLTTHMLMGFTDKELKDRKHFLLDGRQALESTYNAKLDGVPIDITVVVLKKDGCVHDFSYVAPKGKGPEHRAALDRLLDEFTTTSGRPTGRQAIVHLGTPEVRPDEGEAAPETPAEEAKRP